MSNEAKQRVSLPRSSLHGTAVICLSICDLDPLSTLHAPQVACRVGSRIQVSEREIERHNRYSTGHVLTERLLMSMTGCVDEHRCGVRGVRVLERIGAAPFAFVWFSSG